MFYNNKGQTFDISLCFVCGYKEKGKILYDSKFLSIHEDESKLYFFI